MYIEHREYKDIPRVELSNDLFMEQTECHKGMPHL